MVALILIVVGLLLIVKSITLTYAATMTVVETLPNNTGSAADASRKVTHTSYDESGTYTSATTPPVTQIAAFLATLSGGALTIDLRALTGTNGASVDGNGLKVQSVRIKNLGANVMTISTGASNGHNFFTADGMQIQPGGHIQVWSNDNTEDIDATHKTWDIAGTGTQTAEFTVILG